MMRAMLRRMNGDRGQAIILFVGFFTIIVALAAITIDFGIWFSERRGAQTDSDLISLAGVYELLDSSAGFAEVDGATQDSALDNGIDPFADLQNLQVRSLAFPAGYETDEGYCHTAPDTGERLNAVVLDVEHESKALFTDIFGIAAPDVGAHACARAGSLISTTGLRPWSVPRFTSECFVEDGGLYVPQFGEKCIFRIDNPSQVGAIRLGDEEGDDCSGPGAGGAARYRENIVEGSPAICTIGEDIDTEPGLEPNPTKQALQDLLATEGECDALNSGAPDGIDDFAESFQASSGVPGPDVTFIARDCVTPRAISIVIIDEFDGTGFDSVPIRGFATYFLQGCLKLDNHGEYEVDGNGDPVLYRKCDMSGTSFEVQGFFMRLLVLEGAIGAFDEFGTAVIRLAE